MENTNEVVPNEALAKTLINENVNANREISNCKNKIFKLENKIKKNNQSIFINCITINDFFKALPVIVPLGFLF